MWRSSTILFLVALAVLTIGQSTSQTGGEGGERNLTGFTKAGSAAQREIEETFARGISSDAISEFHRDLTRRPHPAGSAGNQQVAAYLEQTLRGFGLETEVQDLSVYLSAPRRVEVEIIAPEPVKLEVHEPASSADPDTAHPDLLPGYVAYSASGEVQAPIVYVNYGLPPDYAKLKAAGVDVRGKIVLARYARSHRAVKVFTAQENGAIGILLYSDPANDGYVQGETWPDGPWRAEYQIQRGNSKYSWFWHGDPLTPGTAATPGSSALDPATAPTLPHIPVTAISWHEAAKILRRLEGPVVPEGFQGGLAFTYHVGPGPVEVRMAVEMDSARRPARNVIATLAGASRPDRMVILGNHYDAWTFGGVDPGSVTAIMLELARGFSAMQRAGWRPARSIMFAFWDAEEFGLVASTEFAEARERDLREGAVCYINSDMYMDGRFDAGGVPSLHDFMVEVARDIPDGARSLYDTWYEEEWQRQTPERRRAGKQGFDVRLKALGSGADFVAFQDYLGLPTLSLEFDFEGSFGAYHSNYDTRFYMERFGDPGFRRGTMLARVLGLTSLRLASADILPFRYSFYTDRIQEFLQDAEGWTRDENGVPFATLNLGGARALARTLSADTAALERKMDAALAAGALAESDLARLNDALARLEQTLLDEDEPADKRWYRHVVYGWNIYSLYDGQPLPGLAEAIRLRDESGIAREEARIEKALQRMLEGVKAASAIVAGRGR
jgi:N-acetylated-alpha-linked acidic dipeptidase